MKITREQYIADCERIKAEHEQTKAKQIKKCYSALWMEKEY
jgi:hypothetical protein